MVDDDVLENAARRAYEGFLADLPAPYRLHDLKWAELPDLLRDCWRNAARAVLKQTHAS